MAVGNGVEVKVEVGVGVKVEMGVSVGLGVKVGVGVTVALGVAVRGNEVGINDAVGVALEGNVNGVTEIVRGNVAVPFSALTVTVSSTTGSGLNPACKSTGGPISQAASPDTIIRPIINNMGTGTPV